MKKLFILISFFLAFLFSQTKFIFAQQEFLTDTVVNYNINDNGSTTVVYNITLTNNISNLYASAYTIKLSGTKPSNPHAYEGDKQLNLIQENSDKDVSLKISFPDQVVGLGNKRNFTITFEDNSLATKTGEVWEISIPKLADPNVFSNYTVKLSAPPSLGELAYVSPDANRIEEQVDVNVLGTSSVTNKTSGENGRKVYVFDKDTVSKTGVTAAFGQFQVFEFDLTYHLENPLNKTAITEIAIPPDTAYQKVNYTS
jgi:hypothetical protein